MANYNDERTNKNFTLFGVTVLVSAGLGAITGALIVFITLL